MKRKDTGVARGESRGFFGTRRKAAEKKDHLAGGKSRRAMKRAGRRCSDPTDEEIMACALTELEEELAELFGE